MNINQKLLHEAIETWGIDAQVLMAMEECGELIVALAQSTRNRPVVVAEEIADVMIMMDQLAIIFGKDMVQQHINEKLQRLEQRLQE